MDPFNHLIKNTRFFIFLKTVAILLVLMSACKTDDDTIDEELPLFGTCEAVSPQGNISFSNLTEGIFTYETSGGGKIELDPAKFINITHKDYSGFNIQLWGTTQVNSQIKNSGNHENLNGKHVKDRIGSVRTLIFPDGAKITMISDGKTGAMLSVSIYDGNQFQHFNPLCNTLEYSSNNSAFAKQFDDTEADGETGIIEFTETGLLYVNIYIEEIAGEKVEERVPIGEIYRDQPNTVNDYWDNTITIEKHTKLTDVVRAEDIAKLKTNNMEVYEGTSPPIINSTITLSPWRFDYANPAINTPIGELQNDVSVVFSNQTIVDQSIEVAFLGDYLKDTYLGSPFITGSGNNFTVCFEVSIFSLSGSSIVINNYAYLISGILDETNMKNVKMAIVGLKSSITNVTNPSVEGDIEIYSDSNGISELIK